MSEELLFSVQGSRATPAKHLTLAEAGLKERRDLQEWIAEHPEILGPDIKIMTMEFDRWTAAKGQTSDRLDILGLHTSGELVVAELKRDKAPDFVEMQALKYAAMVSRFEVEHLVERFANYSSSRGNPMAKEVAEQVILHHAPDISTETLRRPRVILVASEYPVSTMATAVWLNEMGLKVTLIEYRAYQTGSEISISVSQLYPVPEIEDFMISPRQAGVKAADESQGRRADSGVVAKLIASVAIQDGTHLSLRPYGINEDLRSQITAFLAEDPKRGSATWVNDEKLPIKWDFDGERYTTSTLPRKILQEATGDERTLRGGNWWVTDEGRSLVDLSKFEWDEDDFRQKLSDWLPEPHSSRVLEVLDHGLGSEYFDYCYWGGGVHPSANMGFRYPRQAGNPNIGIWSITLDPTDSSFAFNFQWMAQAGVPDSQMDSIAEKMSSFPGVDNLYDGLKASRYMKRPSISVNKLFSSPEAAQTINAIVDQIVSQQSH